MKHSFKFSLRQLIPVTILLGGVGSILFGISSICDVGGWRYAFIEWCRRKKNKGRKGKIFYSIRIILIREVGRI